MRAGKLSRRDMLKASGAAAMTHRLLSHPEPSAVPIVDAPYDSQSTQRVANPADSSDAPLPSTEDSAIAIREREQSAWGQLQEALGETSPAQIFAELKNGAVLSAGQVTALEPLMTSAVPTAARAIAALLIEMSWLDLRRAQQPGRSFGSAPTAAWTAFRQVVPWQQTRAARPPRPVNGIVYEFLTTHPAATYYPPLAAEIDAAAK